MERKSKTRPNKGIIYNSRSGRYEVYGFELIVRFGERVPNFETESFAEAVAYAEEVEGWR